MRLVYAHYKIDYAITEEGDEISIMNFVGAKNVPVVKMPAGVKVIRDEAKDTLRLEGTDLEAVSQAAAAIQQSTRVPHKDTRKFLDGIYVSEKTHLSIDE
eukprot:gnl/Ergobibamus_cyprinoides/2478.p2 GENE.gnl/Ergobibamus_cyprinoides/2478~~gnl/Ergobibamus_cyprinoides/2478.p2  ORF type:complete len:100 (+),score=57.22 gnl/Ergobibamus_cyprinoides/2478:86-385(+)